MTIPHIGCIFDCDGTLVNSMAAWRDVEATIARAGGIELSKADTDALTTFSIPECGRYLHDVLGCYSSADEVVEVINTKMYRFYSEQAVGRPGSLELVRTLHEAGVKMCVASSTPIRELTAGIEHAGFAPYMQAILSVDTVGASKREPKIYLEAARAMGTLPQNTWVFEDAVYAIKTARAAGFRTVGVYDCDLSATWEQLQEGAELAFKSFEDIDPAQLLNI